MNAMEGWSSFAVEQCCDILDSMRVPVNAEDRDKRIGEIPYYGANGLQGYIDDFIFDEPLILIAEDGGCFDEFATRPIAYRIKGKSWVNNHAHVLRAKEAFCQDAVFYNLEHKDIQSFIVGGTRSKLNQVSLRAITLTLPTSKPEQTKIAEILSTVDRAIEQTEALIANQQRIQTGLMQDLLTRGIDEHGNLRSEQTNKFKDSPLGRIPVEWNVVETKEVCSLITKGTTPKLRSVESPRYRIPYLRVQNLTFSGQINFSEEIAFINSATHEGELARSKVLPGDVLQNIVGPPLGKIGIVPSDYPEWNINQAIALFRPNKAVSSEFLCHWLQVPETQTWFDVNSKKTSGQQNLTLQHCQELPIVLPSLEEQTRICRLVECMVISQRTGVSELQKLRSLKTALMQDLLAGKRSITPLLNEAEVMGR